MNKLSIGIIAQHQGAHGVLAVTCGQEAHHHELLPEHAFGFHPMLAAPRHIRPVCLLRDDAFEPHAAGLNQYVVTRLVEVVVIAQAKGLGRCRDHLGKQPLPLLQGNAPHIAPVEIKQVKHIVHHAVVPACLEVGLEAAEAGVSMLILHHDLAVDEGCLGRQRLHRPRNGGKALCPVQPLAGEEPDLATIQPGLDAIAVVLDLMKPPGTCGRPGNAQGKARRDEGRQDRLARTRQLGKSGRCDHTRFFARAL